MKRPVQGQGTEVLLIATSDGPPSHPTLGVTSSDYCHLTLSLTLGFSVTIPHLSSLGVILCGFCKRWLTLLSYSYGHLLQCMLRIKSINEERNRKVKQKVTIKRNLKHACLFLRCSVNGDQLLVTNVMHDDSECTIHLWIIVIIIVRIRHLECMMDDFVWVCVRACMHVCVCMFVCVCVCVHACMYVMSVNGWVALQKHFLYCLMQSFHV